MKIPLSPLLLTCCFTMNALTPLGATPTIASAQHLHQERTHSFLVTRPPAEAFVFFEPVGEKLWAEGWHPLFATEVDATLHNGSVFTVDFPEPDGRTTHSVWSIVHYDPPHRVEYRNVLVGVRATQIAISCEPAAGSSTKVTVRYVYHGLSAAGDDFIRSMTADAFPAYIESWRADIAAYLQRGTPATP